MQVPDDAILAATVYQRAVVIVTDTIYGSATYRPATGSTIRHLDPVIIAFVDGNHFQHAIWNGHTLPDVEPGSKRQHQQAGTWDIWAYLLQAPILRWKSQCENVEDQEVQESCKNDSPGKQRFSPPQPRVSHWKRKVSHPLLANKVAGMGCRLEQHLRFHLLKRTRENLHRNTLKSSPFTPQLCVFSSKRTLRVVHKHCCHHKHDANQTHILLQEKHNLYLAEYFHIQKNHDCHSRTPCQSTQLIR
ncbi:hypothetical protein PsorP6_002301 [Peronosclerospora sorghi]|uniref:Uncharacterized protein n=1 Tax=Peronosclerospora sorghi TaxID=230839 RepID=A0ACC0WTA5_9STRA|nr:hypothetical protein PsorP6_002301 [Peronosclerospora sorghi]